MITPEQLAKSGSEDGEQSALFCQAALHYDQYPQLKWMHAIKNDNGHRRVAQGVRRGVVDIFLPVPQTGLDVVGNFKFYSGLYIELKKLGRQKEKNGGLSDKQIEFLEYASLVGYKSSVCYGWQEAWSTIVDYLEGK
jgi:hypothetical protein